MMIAGQDAGELSDLAVRLGCAAVVAVIMLLLIRQHRKREPEEAKKPKTLSRRARMAEAAFLAVFAVVNLAGGWFFLRQERYWTAISLGVTFVVVLYFFFRELHNLRSSTDEGKTSR